VVILDTGLIFQAALRPLGPAGAVFDALEAGQMQVFLSPRIRSEILYCPHGNVVDPQFR
jgi:predicted nucleic acid-binding protein